MKLKLNFHTWYYCYCKSEEEQEDLIALLDLLGLKPFHESTLTYEYDFCKYILINASGPTWQKTSGPCSVPEFNIDASDFIQANF